MDMQHVRYLLAVTETLNFTRAAEMCGVSQPTLTRAVKAIETELGERMLPFLRRSYENAKLPKDVALAVTNKSKRDFKTCVLKNGGKLEWRR